MGRFGKAKEVWGKVIWEGQSSETEKETDFDAEKTEHRMTKRRDVLVLQSN